MFLRLFSSCRLHHSQNFQKYWWLKVPMETAQLEKTLVTFSFITRDLVENKKRYVLDVENNFRSPTQDQASSRRISVASWRELKRHNDGLSMVEPALNTASMIVSCIGPRSIHAR
jgi:hypothetical protein